VLPLNQYSLVRHRYKCLLYGLSAVRFLCKLRVYGDSAREQGIHFFAAGHHATERYGIKALGEWLAAEYGLDVEFKDIDNPLLKYVYQLRNPYFLLCLS